MTAVDFKSPTPHLAQYDNHYYIIHGAICPIPAHEVTHWREFMATRDSEHWTDICDMPYPKESDFTLIEDYYGNA